MMTKKYRTYSKTEIGKNWIINWKEVALFPTICLTF